MNNFLNIFFFQKPSFLRWLFLIILFQSSILTAQTKLYEGNHFKLSLSENKTFVFYDASIPNSENIAGKIILKNDSIILTRATTNNVEVVFMIMKTYNNYILEVINLQKEFLTQEVPQKFYLIASFYKNGNPKREVSWTKKKDGVFTEYHFGKEKQITSINRYSDFKKHQLQVDFFNNYYTAPKVLKHYKKGVPKGKWYYYEATDSTFSVLKLTKVEVYKKGTKKKTIFPKKDKYLGVK